jgi:peptide/nickel transport system permease protein
MIRFIIRGLIQAVFVLLGVSVVVFLLLHLTGDPAALMLPPDAPKSQLIQLRHTMGLDRPIWVQYLHFIGGVVRGDFGRSLISNESALGIVFQRLPATIELAIFALLFALVVAFPLGTLAAIRRGTWIDRLAMIVTLIGQAIPVFWLGIMLILLFAVTWRIFPPGGYATWGSFVLPGITLGMYSMARTARLVRSGMLEVLGEDYIRTARAKGLASRAIISRHAMKNALIPIITVIGLDLATLLGGAVITETIFSWPGIGRLAITSIGYRDYPVVQAVVFVTAAGYVLLNLAVDVLYAYLDPRIHYS